MKSEKNPSSRGVNICTTENEDHLESHPDASYNHFEPMVYFAQKHTRKGRLRWWAVSSGSFFISRKFRSLSGFGNLCASSPNLYPTFTNSLVNISTLRLPKF